MAFLDKLFRWKKKPFGGKPVIPGGKPAQISATQKFQSGKEGAEKIELRGTGKYADVLLRPHTSEKAVGLGALNQYVFEVAPGVSSTQIAQAMVDLYGILPQSINLINVDGKHVRSGRGSGVTKAWKKAIVTLPEGKTIDLYKT